MSHRLAWGALLLGVALGCEGKEVNEPGVMHSAGASAAGASGTAGSPDDAVLGGAAGALSPGGDAGEGGAAGAGGAAAVPFWTDATQHLEIACFGFFDGLATFRAEREQLSAEELELLATQSGVPGSDFDGNDDQIHCVVTTTDARDQERQFTIDTSSDLIGRATSIGGEGGATGDSEGIANALLGCEFHHPFSGPNRPPFSANPRCLRDVWPEGESSSYGLDLTTAGKPYHVELVHCSQKSLAGITVALFGGDTTTPLAVGVAPAEPGPDQACLVLDAQVAAPVVAQLVFTAPSASHTGGSLFVFR